MQISKNNLRKKATKSAVYGAIIAMVAIIIATSAVSYFTFGSLTLGSLIQAQKTNVALWMLDMMPFVFMFWGQYVGSVLIEEADVMIIRETHKLWDKTRQLHDEIEQERKYDRLTQLPNTNHFMEMLDRTIQKVARKRTDSGTFIQTLSNYITKGHDASHTVAIIMLDVDNFKKINSTLGSQSGDELLKEISFRLKKMFMDSEMVISRVGGDDFAMFEAGRSEHGIIKATNQIRQLFDQSFDLGGIAVMLEINIGISIYPQHGDTSRELLKNAEIAMYADKKEAQKYTFYSPALNAIDLSDLLLKAEIRGAFDNNELCLHYQPKVNAQNQVNEVEALVRWIHPEKGLIPPDRFIPMIVKKRMNGELLQRILTLALDQAKEWRKDNISMRIALNLTAFDLLEPDLPVMIEKMLREYGLKADVLKLEITETTLVENQELTLKSLTTFAEMGIPSSIDDFGTGYSSLAYLSSLPIAEIKIDQSFVVGMIDNDRNDKIIHAIIALAHSLSLYTVAEGVEDAQTMEQLKHLKCDFIQGYHISRPLDGPAFTSWLKTWDKNNPAPMAKVKEKNNI